MPEPDFSAFPALSASAWRALIERDLKGRPFDTLRWEVEPGLRLDPFHTLAADSTLAPPPSRGKTTLLQYLPGPDLGAAHEALDAGVGGFFVDSPEPLPVEWPDVFTRHAPDLRAFITGGSVELDHGVRVAMPVIDGLTLHEAGATRVETLAWMAAQASEWLRASAEDGRGGALRLEAFVGVGPEFVAEIAAVRSLRLLLDNVIRAYGATNTEIHVTAVTSRYHLTAFAPHTNLLRNTLAAAAAFVGGADALAVRPHDLLIGPTPDGLRLARQAHLLLRDESHLSRIADPAAGAFSVDRLTSELSRMAWARFQEIEAAGGFFEAAERLDLDGTVRRQHHERQAAVLTGRRRIVGVTRSPDATDAVSSIPEERTETLAPQRLSAPLEKLRFTVSQQPAPNIELLLFGQPAQRSARAGFTRDFLAVAGLSAREVQAVDELDENTSLVVLCAGDDDYATDAATYITQLRARVPDAQVWIAGTPESMPALREAGAAFFLSARAPLYDHLRDALATLHLID